MVDDGQLMISMMVDYGDVNRRTCLQNGLNTGTFAKRECVASATNEWDILETNMCDYGYPAKSTVLFRYEGTFLQCEHGFIRFKAGYGNQQWGSRPEINRYTMVYTAKIHQTY